MRIHRRVGVDVSGTHLCKSVAYSYNVNQEIEWDRNLWFFDDVNTAGKVALPEVALPEVDQVWHPQPLPFTLRAVSASIAVVLIGYSVFVEVFYHQQAHDSNISCFSCEDQAQWDTLRSDILDVFERIRRFCFPLAGLVCSSIVHRSTLGNLFPWPVNHKY